MNFVDNIFIAARKWIYSGTPPIAIISYTSKSDLMYKMFLNAFYFKSSKKYRILINNY